MQSACSSLLKRPFTFFHPNIQNGVRHNNLFIRASPITKFKYNTQKIKSRLFVTKTNSFAEGLADSDEDPHPGFKPFHLPLDVKDEPYRICILAGEPSGDVLGAKLMAAIKKKTKKDIVFGGIGGTFMTKEGLERFFPMDDIAIMGFGEVIPKLLKLKKLTIAARNSIDDFEPDVLVTIDSKGFNFRVLELLADKDEDDEYEFDYPVIHYVGPTSLWTTKQPLTALNKIRNKLGMINHTLLLFPHEKKIYDSARLESTFVGHPIIEEADLFKSYLPQVVGPYSVNKPDPFLKRSGNGEAFKKQHNIDPNAVVVCCLPGSRKQEVNRMLPIFQKSIQKLQDQLKQPIHVITPTTDIVHDIVDKQLKRWKVQGTTVFLNDDVQKKYDAFAASKIALAASGSVTLELNMAQLPVVVGYQTNWLTRWMIKRNVAIEYASIANIIRNKPIIPEFIFENCEPGKIADAMSNLITDENARKKHLLEVERALQLLVVRQKEVKTGKMYLDVASDRAASVVLNYASQSKLSQ